jgi:biotin carboxyl carrier protein
MDHIDEKEYGEFPLFSISSGIYRTELTPKFKKKTEWIRPDPKKIIAIIPGTILDVFVKNGQTAKKGDVLLLLEAMKMQNQILMPIDGKIKKVYVKPDEVVKRLQVMIEID